MRRFTIDQISSKLESALCLELQKIVKSISAPGKGLLACDESPSNLEERFQEIGINNTESTRRAYREMLLSADKSQFSQYISGVILHHEMIHQRTSEDVEFIEFLRRRNIVAGVKVDRGLVHLFNTEDEKITLGLDNLQENCVRYKQEGCHLAEWKCVFSISERCPSQLAMIANANVLARFASICQRTRMVPIVEPEILNNGEYDIDRALQVHEEMLSILFRALNEYHVYLEGMVLKLAMVLSGIKNAIKCTPQIVAEYTLRALRRTVPMAVPAIFFLNGDQTDEEANTVIKIWKNNPENVDKAQAMFLKRVKLCSEASLGKLRVQDNNSLCELNRFNFLSL
ncbi:Fructose-bisphosphate aldolase [Cyphomyrmex costatus]|uniref:fructose-bisphosphate aldolase n=1 Tax=Cyphomyrmex costatus TaxID=456900 RepID=A0A151IIY6_9HYME|nr:Fructose-bisphosphate aldolase [Cyphomyrmex costatus]